VKNNSIKILTIVGTRPEIIRLSRVLPLLDRQVQHILVHTGQNYDYELNEIFFKDLELRNPDYFLNVDTSSLGRVLGETLIKIEKVFVKEKPDALLILGDTNSSIAGILAKRFKIPIYHMEAGNRCFDLNVPEEINRRIIDHIADFNLVYTEHARRHLLSEGLPHRRIYLTGSPMLEVLQHYAPKIAKSQILTSLNIQPNNYFLVSTHREENVDDPEILLKLLNILTSIITKYDKDVIVSTHPRTKKRLAALENISLPERIKFLKPFGFTDYIHLQQNALCTISDSGTISEESSILNFPAITIRNATERPEALDTGSMMITGFHEKIVLAAIDIAMRGHESHMISTPPVDYQITNTSWRVLKLIVGTCKLSNQWNGIKIIE
jgi:UDP-N-acetyl-L-fucosamine synthase